MSVDLPEMLKGGEVARLIPVAYSSQKERSAASVLLATLCVVRPFAEIALGTLQRTLGSRSTVSAFTEVVCKKQLPEVSCRPDGLLIVSTPRSEWRALVEAKIGTAKINPAQLSLYCKLAALNDVDAVITISNELTSLPQHPPYEIPAGICGNLEIFHWSWMKLITLATILVSSADDEFDPEQHFILKEMLRYFSHENTEVRGFHQMNSEWPVLLERVHSGADVRKAQTQVVETIRAWHQEQSDMCLILSRKLKVAVTTRLKKFHRESQSARVDADAEEFVTTKRLTAAFEIPNVAGPIEVIADALKRNIICQMCVNAPEDKKRYESRLNWLLRQLPDEPDVPVGIHIRWRNGGTSFGWLGDLRTNPKSADIDRSGALPKCFEVFTVTDLGKKFAGTKNFIEVLEGAVPQFYDNVARHIRAWQPSPMTGPVEGEETLADTVNRLPEPKLASKRIVRRGEVGSGRFVMFEDGSIEVETPSGVKRFRSIDELVASARSTKPQPTPTESNPPSTS